jgi:hypothetical protein
LGHEASDDRDDTGHDHGVAAHAMRARPHGVARQRPRRPNAEDEIRPHERHQIAEQDEHQPECDRADLGHVDAPSERVAKRQDVKATQERNRRRDDGVVGATELRDVGRTGVAGRIPLHDREHRDHHRGNEKRSLESTSESVRRARESPVNGNLFREPGIDGK